MLTQKEAAEKIAAQVAIMTAAYTEAHRIAEEQGWDVYGTYDLPEIESEEGDGGPISDAIYDLARWSSSNC